MLDLPILQPGTQMQVCASQCGGGCCQYFSLQLDTPTSNAEFDAIRWYLMHEDTHVYRYEDGWYLMILRRCRNLQPNNLCGIYETRPDICRDYDARDCEFTDKVPYQLYFRNEKEFEAWLAERTAARRVAARKASATRARRSAGKAAPPRRKTGAKAGTKNRAKAGAKATARASANGRRTAGR